MPITVSVAALPHGAADRYDVCDQSTFDAIEPDFWEGGILRHCGDGANQPTVMLVGNKCKSEDRVVSTEQGKAGSHYLRSITKQDLKYTSNTNGLEALQWPFPKYRRGGTRTCTHTRTHTHTHKHTRAWGFCVESGRALATRLGVSFQEIDCKNDVNVADTMVELAENVLDIQMPLPRMWQ
jgi:hypothetical protein